MATTSRFLPRLLWGALVLIVLLLGAALGVLVYLDVPQNAAGMAAKGICSVAFVAGRGKLGERGSLLAEEVLPASPVLAVIRVDIDEKEKRTTGKFAGMFTRTAMWMPNRGCVLDAAGSQLASDSIY